METVIGLNSLKFTLTFLAIVSAIFVISTKNAVISVFNLIVLYILVAFYLIYVGITYLGISYVVIYIGAIAILFLFVIMMIDIEVIETKNNNYLPLLLVLLLSFVVVLKSILYNLGVIKVNNIKKIFYQSDLLIKNENVELFNIRDINSIIISKDMNKGINNYELFLDNTIVSKDNEVFIDLNLLYNNMLNMNDNNNWIFSKYSNFIDNNYLLIMPNWDSAVSRVTQISAIGDVLYTVYHSYIYIVSIILLLGMIGAIILTGNTYQEIKTIAIKKNKISNLFFFILLLVPVLRGWYYNILNISYNFFKFSWNKIKETLIYLYINKMKEFSTIENNAINSRKIINKVFNVSPLFFLSNDVNVYSEGIIGNLIYFIIANILIGFLLLFINSYFSLSVKYLEKGGGFECGFTSFVQTRERFNVIFYRVSLLFLVFDLEIILAFPYMAIYQKNQNISKNNILAFLYILIVGFIYELKEGALNIVKKAHNT